MKIIETSGEERDIAIAFIASTIYIQRILDRYQPFYIESKPIQSIIGICISYFQKYNEAPRKHIYGLIKKLKYKSDDGSYRLIVKFIESLKVEIFSKDFNATYYIEETLKYFAKRSIEDLTYELSNLVEHNEVDKAIESINGFTLTKDSSGMGISVFDSPGSIEAAFGEDLNPLFKFPGALGRMMNANLVRGGFVAFLAPNKRGKTFWLNELFIRSLSQRNNTAIIQIGDLSESEMIRRLAVTLSGRHYLEEYCKEIVVPVYDCKKNQNNTCTMKHRSCRIGIELNAETTIPLETAIENGYKACDYCRKSLPEKYSPTHWFNKLPDRNPIQKESAFRVFRSFKKRLKGVRGFLKTVPSDSLSPEELGNILNTWKNQDDFIPSVILIDSADNMTSRNKEFRHRVNEIWSGLRALSLTWNNLIITSTQGDAKSFDQNVLTKMNFSEDKRKLDHVTAMFGLNQTEDEKEEFVIRLNTIVNRSLRFDSRKCVYVLQSLQLGKAFLGSYDQTPTKRNSENHDKKEDYANSKNTQKKRGKNI